jgi:rod shape-determining protein MreC
LDWIERELGRTLIMLDIFSRYRQMTLLAAVVFMQVLLLAFQIRRDHQVRLIRVWAAEIVTPFGRAGTWSFGRIGGVWGGYFGLHGAHAENARLQHELDQLQIQNRELESRASEADRLSALLNFRSAHPEVSILAAQVIEASADNSSHTVFINRGERDHLRNNLAVITPDGIVGKIVEVFPSTAQVLLLNDKDSGVGALFGDTRTHGVVKGNGDPTPRMDYVVNDEKVHVGEQILTSGEDRIFPKGLAIGTVMDSSPATPFQLIHVRTAARLDRLEDVLVLLSQQDLAPKQTDQVSAQVNSASGVAPAAPVDSGKAIVDPSKVTGNKPVSTAVSNAPAAPKQ